MLVFNKEVNNLCLIKIMAAMTRRQEKTFTHIHSHTHTHTHIQILNRRQQHQSIFNNDYLSGSCTETSFFLPKVKFYFYALLLWSGRGKVKGMGKGRSPYSIPVT